jgi:hypothetical protein
LQQGGRCGAREEQRRRPGSPRGTARRVSSEHHRHGDLFLFPIVFVSPISLDFEVIISCAIIVVGDSCEGDEEGAREVEEEAKDERRSAPTTLEVFWYVFSLDFLMEKMLHDLKVLLINLQVICGSS